MIYQQGVRVLVGIHFAVQFAKRIYNILKQNPSVSLSGAPEMFGQWKKERAPDRNPH